MSKLQQWGWTAHEQQHWTAMPAEFIPARVTARFQSHWRVVTPSHQREQLVEISGAFQYLAAGSEDFPVVGDWVALSADGKLIQQVLPRRSAIIRQEAGRTAGGQVLTANVDTAFLVFGLDGGRNFSIGLLERFLTITAAGKAKPAAVLNKADCATPQHIDSVCCQISAITPSLPVIVTSIRTGDGLDDLRKMVPAGETACCLGRSGVGKSSIMNALLGRTQQKTAEVSRIENRGRHTTSSSQLMMLPSRLSPEHYAETTEPGGLLIDTPGLRELQLWGDEDALLDSFSDVRELAHECRFSDCRHQGEPGCAVQAAAAEGFLPQQRLEHFLEQRDELNTAELRRSMSADAYERHKWKKISKTIRRM